MEKLSCYILIFFVEFGFLVRRQTLLISLPESAYRNKACPVGGNLLTALFIILIEIRSKTDIDKTDNGVERLHIGTDQHL